MRKTYCDRCGAECHYRNGHLHLSESHQTAGGQEVGMDEYRPIDLCSACIDALREWAGKSLVVANHYEQDGEMSRAVMAAPVTPFPRAADPELANETSPVPVPLPPL